MSKHTPGPWALMRSEREAEWIVNQSGGAGYVCTAPLFAHRAAQCEANARLIAAAPELLEALKEAEHWVAEYVSQMSAYTVSESASESLSRIYAAIAKAEGDLFSEMTEAEYDALPRVIRTRKQTDAENA